MIIDKVGIVRFVAVGSDESVEKELVVGIEKNLR
jgi:hypothetical protein